MKHRSARQRAGHDEQRSVERPHRRAVLAGSSYSVGIAFSLASFGSIAIVMLFTSVLSARLYGITVIGQAALALAPVAIVTLLSTVREQPAMVRELAKLKPRHPRVTGVFLAVFTFSFVLTAAVTAVGVVICYFVFRGPLHEPELVVPAAAGLCGYLLVINTCWNIDGVLGAFRAGRELFAVRLHQAIVYGVLVAAFTLVTHSVWGLVLAFLGSWLTALVHRLLVLPRIVRWRVPMTEIRAGFSTLHEIVTFGLKLTPGSLASSLSDTSGTWILGATSSVDAIGAYSRAWNLAARLGELNWRITEMLLPTLVQHRHAGDTEGFDRVLVDSLRYAAFGLLLPAAVCGGAAEAVMHVFGAGFGAAAPALRCLLFVPVLQTIIAIQGAALMASNRPLLTVIMQFTRLAVTITGGVVLALSLGVTGMAIAMTGGAAVSSCAYLVLLRLRLGTLIPTLAHYRQIAGFSVAYASGFAVSHLIEREIHGILGLMIALLAGSLAYVALGIGVGGMTHRDRARLKVAIRRLTGSRMFSADMSGVT
jgi:O-antigen/teichoic acid export membrane protein